MSQAFLCRVMWNKIELTLHHFHCQDLNATLFQGQEMQKKIDLQLYIKLQLNQWSKIIPGVCCHSFFTTKLVKEQFIFYYYLQLQPGFHPTIAL